MLTSLAAPLLVLLIAAVVVALVLSMARVFRRLKADLAVEKERAERNAPLADMVMLAAGAAHEMSTPLATIAVTAKEMERAGAEAGHTRWIDDARLIRGEVERCRGLLAELRSQAGSLRGEVHVPVSLGEAVLAAISELPDRARRQVSLTQRAESVGLRLPRTTFVRVLANLIRNAIEASQPGDSIVVDGYQRDHLIVVSVTDSGHGMDVSIARRAREPFFTTKPAGAGLGLGLFLADRFARDLGGTLALESSPGQGTQVRLQLPKSPGSG